jgi:hypothetical protein
MLRQLEEKSVDDALPGYTSVLQSELNRVISSVTFPDQRAVFLAQSDVYSQMVRRTLTAEDVDMMFAPRAPDEVTTSFFPGFATLRQKDVSPKVWTRFSKIPQQWRGDWHARLYLNTVSAIADYDKEVREILTTKGPLGGDEKSCKTISGAIDREWGFGLWSYAPAAAAPLKTYFCFDLLVLGCCFIIESVESRVDGRPGGWHLVDEVLHVLDAQGTQCGVSWIHTTATNPDAASIFRHYGFVDAPTEGRLISPRATPLRRAVRPPTRRLDAPPPDLQHLSSGAK